MRVAGFSMLHPQPLFPVDAGDLCRPDLLLYPLLLQATDPKIRIMVRLKKSSFMAAIVVIFFKIFIRRNLIHFDNIPLEINTFFSLACL